MFLFACSNTKEKTEDTESEEIAVIEDSKEHPDYIQLAVGNYWIYKTLSIDSEGTETFVREDSIYIASDTLINDVLYFKYIEAPALSSRDTLTKFLRDSSGYLIDAKGTILFSSHNFTDTLRHIDEEQIYSIDYIMEKSDAIEILAGTFKNVLAYKGLVWIKPLFDNWDHPDSYNDYYAPGVGLIKSTCFFITKPVFIERQLIRYHINH